MAHVADRVAIERLSALAEESGFAASKWQRSLRMRHRRHEDALDSLPVAPEPKQPTSQKLKISGVFSKEEWRSANVPEDIF